MGTRKITGRQIGVTALVIVAVLAALVLAVMAYPVGGPPEGMVAVVLAFARRWFFAIFSTAFALVQFRVYLVRRRQEALLASHVPVSAFGLFTALWFVLAIAAIAYGVLQPDGWWEAAGWVTLGVVISVQLIVLGGLEQRSDST